MQPYKALADSSRLSATAIGNSPPTTVFTGLWQAVRDREAFLGVVAFTGILAKFMPTLLGNVPYYIKQTWMTHVVTGWMTAAILIWMILVLAWSYFVKWPRLPVDPDTIAGRLHYVCDSSILEDFEGTSKMSGKEWKEHLREMGRTRSYRFGNMVGVSLQPRVGVYREKDLG